MRPRLLRTFGALLALAAVTWTGCDAVSPDARVHPDVRLAFVEPVMVSDAPAGKRAPAPPRLDAVPFTVLLTVRDAATGEDFSPDPATVEDTDGEAFFTLNLAPDALYTFEVRFDQAGTTVAEGASWWYVDQRTTAIDVPIIPLNPSVATLGFLPGRVRTRPGSGTLDLTMRYYGTDTEILGLACRLDVTGIQPADLTWSGPDVALVSGQQLELAWNWDTPITQRADLAVLSIPLEDALSAGFTIQQGNLRVVDPGGGITLLQAVGADVEITP